MTAAVAPGCKHDDPTAFEWNDYCGTKTCLRCGTDHLSGSGDSVTRLARCYCGFSASGGDGRRELIDMGERIEPLE